MSDDLAAKIAALEAKVEELERKAKPPAPFKSDYVPPSPNRLIDRISMPPSAMADLVNCVGDGTIKEIVKSGGVAVLQSTTTTPTPTRVAEQNRSGWRDAQPLSNPPGVAIADRLVDAQDARDRAELIAAEARRLAKK
jgi:hypothetical protein